MKLVLDTAVMVAGIRSGAGASRVLLRRALTQPGDPRLLLSVPLLIEYEAVMTRAEHLEAARLSAADVGVLLDALTSVAEPVTLAFLWRPVLPDANDDMVLETAANGGADVLVTFNRRDFDAGARRFGFRVASPRDVLAELEVRG